MPLPRSDTPWPPAELATIEPKIREWAAWWAGDTARLDEVYRDLQRLDRPSQYRGGVQGTLSRAFYGHPVGDLTRPRRQLHVPIAADICQASADLLFAEPPTFTVPQPAAQDRLNEYNDDGLHTTLAEAAEAAAALSGVFLRVSWDPVVMPGRPFVSIVDADAAWPEFRWGNLTAVTFWWVVKRDGNTVIRHLERHELDGQGLGLVVHGLYEGTHDDLGQQVPLTEHPTTEPFADLVAADGALRDGRTPGLAVVYVPNQRPQRRWRNDALGRNLGRSDLDGIEPLMDRLDAAWTSWMRDLDLGRARIIVAKEMLRDLGPGQGASFDLDQEIFTPVNAPPGSIASGAGTGITPQQFEIRVAEHQQTTQALVEQILRSAGYSAQTFGEGDTAGGQVTATEVDARNQRSFTTRDRKIRLWRPRTGQLLAKLLTVDAALFGGSYDPDGIDVEFPEAVQESPSEMAQTAQLLEAAGAASTQTKVQMVHPEWDDEQVQAEVRLIHAEHAMAVPDPIGLGEQPLGDPAAGTVGA